MRDDADSLIIFAGDMRPLDARRLDVIATGVRTHQSLASAKAGAQNVLQAKGRIISCPPTESDATWMESR